MLLTRTPYRVSFFGGGTDYHGYYREHGGAVLSTTIDKYAYITARFLPPFFKERSRVVWSKIEAVANNADIEHPAVRACLKMLDITQGVEITHTGDLPARAGLGSSSTFTVGLLNALQGLLGHKASKYELAVDAVHIEREMLKENVGVQDQIAAAYGGFNKITLLPNGVFQVDRLPLRNSRILELQNHLLLFYTGVSRTASDIAKQVVDHIEDKRSELAAMARIVIEAENVIIGAGAITEFGRLLHESWLLKRSLAVGIAPGFVDDIYAKARNAGAIGGKLLGAGGGGFMLFFAKPEKHAEIKIALEDLLCVPFAFEGWGSQIILHQPDAYSRTSQTRRNYHHLKV